MSVSDGLGNKSQTWRENPAPGTVFPSSLHELVDLIRVRTREFEHHRSPLTVVSFITAIG